MDASVFEIQLESALDHAVVGCGDGKSGVDEFIGGEIAGKGGDELNDVTVRIDADDCRLGEIFALNSEFDDQIFIVLSEFEIVLVKVIDDGFVCSCCGTNMIIFLLKIEILKH